MTTYLLVRCENCGGEVMVQQDYDPDYSEYGAWRLVHQDSGDEWCPEPERSSSTK